MGHEIASMRETLSMRESQINVMEAEIKRLEDNEHKLCVELLRFNKEKEPI